MRVGALLLLAILASSTASAAKIEAETIVVFPQSAIACLDLDDLREITMMGMRKERTRMEGMMAQNGGSCLMLEPGKRFRVIHSEYNNPDLPDWGLIQIVGEQVRAATKGAWTYTVGAEVVSPKIGKPKQK